MAKIIRLENDILGNEAELKALEAAMIRSTYTRLKRQNKKLLSLDLDSTEDPAHSKQEGVAFNGHFAKNQGVVGSKALFNRGAQGCRIISGLTSPSPHGLGRMVVRRSA